MFNANKPEHFSRISNCSDIYQTVKTDEHLPILLVCLSAVTLHRKLWRIWIRQHFRPAEFLRPEGEAPSSYSSFSKVSRAYWEAETGLSLMLLYRFTFVWIILREYYLFLYVDICKYNCSFYLYLSDSWLFFFPLWYK